MENECIAPFIVNLGAKWTWMVILNRGRAPGAHWIRGWVDPRASFDAVEKKWIFFPATELWFFGHPARGPSLYWMSYPIDKVVNIYTVFDKLRRDIAWGSHVAVCYCDPTCCRKHVINVRNKMQHKINCLFHDFL